MSRRHSPDAAPGLRRELRVAFSTEAQPLWFRIAKWVAFVAITRRLRASRWLVVWIVGGALTGGTLHAVYRWKTRGWTRAWGGWNDVETAQGRPRRSQRDGPPTRSSLQRG